MNQKFTIKNFRVFGSDGVTFNMSPITILTGCNSSGKSSVVKSLLLMRNLLEQAKNDKIKNDIFDPTKYSLNFSLPELKLGTFDQVLNRGSEDSCITFSYTIKPGCAYQEYRVDYIIGKREGDSLNRGWIKEIKLYDAEDNLVVDLLNQSTTKMNPVKVSLSCQFQTNFIYFIMSVIETIYADNVKGCYNPLDGGVEDQESFDKWVALLKDFCSKNDNGFLQGAKYFKDEYRKVAYSGKHKELLDLNLLPAYERANEYNIFFYFPILSKFVELSKNSAIQLLESASCEDYFDANAFKKEKALIIDGFQKSSRTSFIDYFRDYENDELDDLTKNIKLYVESGSNDIITRVKSNVSVLHDTNNAIHFGAIYSDEEVNFNILYNFFSRWQGSINDSEDEKYIERTVLSGLGCQSRHLFGDALMEYLALTLEECLLPDTFDGIKYIGNFHSEVKRLYSFDDKSSNMGQMLESYLSLKARLSSKSTYEPLVFTNKWLNELKIGKGLNIVCDTDGLGAKLYLIDKNDTMCPLADEGYGVSQIVNFLLHIEIEILKSKVAELRNSMPYDERETQELPVSVLAIEEPEVSLHPSLQSALTMVFVDAYQSYGIHFVIETHSEYLIRKTQVYVKNLKEQGEDAINPFSVYYVPKEGGHIPYKMEYRPDGKFKNEFGPGFFDEASNLAFELF